jgi:hypothetical protein
MGQTISCRNPDETPQSVQNLPLTILFNGKPHTIASPLPSLEALIWEIRHAYRFEPNTVIKLLSSTGVEIKRDSDYQEDIGNVEGKRFH